MIKLLSISSAALWPMKERLELGLIPIQSLIRSGLDIRVNLTQKKAWGKLFLRLSISVKRSLIEIKKFKICSRF
jgi:hypothetical protein